MIEKTWRTYAEAATFLGLSVEGVRQRARREHWRKTLGNDGKALVMLPEDAAPSPAGDADGNQSDEAVRPSRAPAKPPAGDLETLRARIADLQASLSREREDRDRERAEARADLDRERAERLAERERADRLASDLTEFTRKLAETMEQVRDAAVLRANLESALADLEQAKAFHALELSKAITARQEDADRSKAELDAWKARPWWKRIAG